MTTLNIQIAAGADDAYEADDGSGFNSTGTQVRCKSHVSDPATRFNAGFRFTGVTIPQGTTITAAALTISPIDSTDDIVNGDIKGEAADDAVSFVTNADVTSRARTTASVQWIQSDIPVDTASPDIAAVIQEIIDRAGWVSGNALVVFMDGRNVAPAGNARIASYEHTTRNPASLSITYSSTQEVAIAGSAASSGAHVGRVNGNAAGASGSVGLHRALMAKLFAGASTPTGSLSFLTPFLVAIAGASTSAGALTTFRTLSAVLAGASTSAGVQIGKILQNFSGASSAAGGIQNVAQFVASGASTSAGVLALLRNMLLQGVSDSEGALLGIINARLSGVSASSGLLSFLQPALQIVGRLRARITDRDGTPRGNILP